MVHCTGHNMIFLHRQNDLDKYSKLNKRYPSVEVDVRSSPDGLILHHDRLNFNNKYPEAKKLKTLAKNIILNIKESGIEEELIEIFNNSDFYFLDSQIPDILRISKLHPEHSHRFILRVSDVEHFNCKMVNLINPKYIWLDYSEFNSESFNIDEYIRFVKTTKLMIETESELNPELNSELILVSPELYSLENLNLTKEIIERLKSEKLNRYSVCTKFPELYKDLECSI